jgi:hypothetical protein
MKVEYDLSQLADEFPTARRVDRVDAYRRADVLSGHAYDVGVEFWDQKLSESEAVRRLAARCPGYGHQTYEVAARNGIHTAMW